ncbi:MSHA biogenesis protein MshQ [Oxalobacteraceae bacterium GrIS 1.11]
MIKLIIWLWLALLACWAPAQAVTYANITTTFNWIDASTHSKVGYNTVPYKFNGATGCGTTPPILDDTLSDVIPIGFNFNFAGIAFSSLRIMSNGRVHFNGNVTCGFGSPVQQLPYPDASLNYTMRIYGNDLDPTLKSDLPSYNTNCVSKLSCYVSYATIGTAPYRSFVVTWNNVPEWTTGANPTGSYSLQLILQENGEFVYQYGADVPGPSAALGQVGWQVDSSDYDTPKTGFPLSNSAVKFYIPRPVAEYLMEQASWSGAAGQVQDTSGNAKSGSALGAAQTISAGKVCRAANFPLNSSTATVDAINTGIAMPTTVGGAGTMTFWYKANTAWSGGGARDAQLFDATLVNNQWFFLVRRSNGHLRFVITDSLGNVQAVETAAIAVGAATWKHIAVSWNFNALAAANSDHMRIYVDGVLQLEQAFTTNGTLSSQIGSLYLGDNRSNIIGSLGTGNSADGVFDEVRIYNYEGGLALVQRDMNLSQAGCLSHYAISDSGTGLSCQQSSVTLTAHNLAHGNFTMPNNTTQIQLSTSTGLGDWSLISGYGVLDNGVANDGNATYLFNGEYQAIFGLSHGTAATVTVHATDGQFVDQENQAIVFKACAIAKFNACEMALPRCVPSGVSSAFARLYTKLANTAFKLELVKLKNDATLETTFNGTATVDLLLNSASGAALDANNCPLSQTAVIPLGSATFVGGYTSAGVSVAANALSGTAPGYSAYREARIRVTCNAANCGTANVACSTDSFAVRPKDFTLASNMSNTAQSGTPRLNAGAPFTLTATAVPGYNGTPLIDNSLAGHKVVSHVGITDYTDRLGNVAGLSPVPLNAATVATGVASDATVKYDDVGNFQLLQGGIVDASYTSVDQPGDCLAGSAANVADSSGKFGCNIASQATTALFGRFYPDHYDVSAGLSGACNGFTYMGQRELGIALAATAASSGNLTLNHYTAGYATLASIAFSGDNNGSAMPTLNSRMTPAFPAFVWSGGRTGRFYSSDAAGYAAGATSINVTGNGTVLAGDVVRFVGDSNKYVVATGIAAAGALTLAAPGLAQAIPNTATAMTVLHSVNRLGSKAAPAPDGPYDVFSVKMALNDADGAGFASINGTPFTPNSTILFGTTKLRYGRLRIDNAYGSELMALPVGLSPQYWNGAAYVVNALDSCTSLAAANFSLTAGRGGAINSAPGNGASISGGVVKNFKLAKPNPAPTRTGNVILSTVAPLDDFLPGVGTETFGIYKAPLTYVRESY